MFKKAGIIVGVVIIVVALALNFFFNRDKEPKDGVADNGTIDNINQIPTQQESIQQPVVQEPVEQPKKEQPTKNSNPKESSDLDISKPTDTKTTGTQVLTVDEGQLGEAIRTETEIVILSKKRVILLDSNTNSTSGMQIVYSLDLITSNNISLSHMVSGGTYEAFEVGDKLKLTYSVYKNVNGVDFYAIDSLEQVE